MKNNLLIPNRYKVFGWIIFLAFTSFYLFCNIIYPKFISNGNRLEIPGFNWAYPALFDWSISNLTPVVLSSGIFIGLLIICFSKEKKEDEYISFIRLRSWQWAVLTSYGILFFANWLIYGAWFFAFITINLLTVPLIFIIKFNYSLYCLQREKTGDEK